MWRQSDRGVENGSTGRRVKVLDADEAVCMRKEAFAPILSILAVKSTEEAIEFINDKYPNPLSLYIFSKSAKTQRLILDNTKSGGVCINSVIYQAGHEWLTIWWRRGKWLWKSPRVSRRGIFPTMETSVTENEMVELVRFRFSFDSNIVYPPYGMKLHLVKNLLRLARLF